MTVDNIFYDKVSFMFINVILPLGCMLCSVFHKCEAGLSVQCSNVTVRGGVHHIMHCWVRGQSEAEGRGLTPDPAVHYLVYSDSHSYIVSVSSREGHTLDFPPSMHSCVC